MRKPQYANDVKWRNNDEIMYTENEEVAVEEPFMLLPPVVAVAVTFVHFQDPDA